MFVDVVQPDPSALATTRGVRLGTLIPIRWGAIGGQAATLLVVHYGLGFPVMLSAGFAVLGASVLLNLGLAVARPAHERLGESASASLLAFDIVQLTALLYLTGGLENPFAFLLLAPLTVSATILGLRSTAALCGLTLAAVTLLALDHLDLPWSAAGFALPRMYVLGSWVALALGIGFFASYTWRVAEEARRMQNALAATQLALVREQQLSTLGGIAAAAAHELGSPLGTIAVVTGELAREVAPDSPIADDVELLLSESRRCADILASLEQGAAEAMASDPYPEPPLDAVIEAAAKRHDDAAVRLRVVAEPEGEGATEPPIVRSRAEIIHGIGNLVQNAVQFARSEVSVSTRWSHDRIRVTIEDDGPGIPSRLLERLGEPYVSSRTDDGAHMGLGIFIARTLLQRTGATITFGNAPAGAGGARVEVVWDRAALAAPARPGPGGDGWAMTGASGTPGDPEGQGAGRDRTLLIVEDDAPFRIRLARAMETRGFQVETAATIAEGIAAAESRPPAFAVLDLRLGDGSGLEVVAALRKARADARIVVLTGYGNIATAVDYLAKPADADAIEAALLAPAGALPPPPEQPMSADRARWEHIQRVYEQCERNVSETARRLNMHRRTLQRILSKRAPRDPARG